MVRARRPKSHRLAKLISSNLYAYKVLFSCALVCLCRICVWIPFAFQCTRYALFRPHSRAIKRFDKLEIKYAEKKNFFKLILCDSTEQTFETYLCAWVCVYLPSTTTQLIYVQFYADAIIESICLICVNLYETYIQRNIIKSFDNPLGKIFYITI